MLISRESRKKSEKARQLPVFGQSTHFNDEKSVYRDLPKALVQTTFDKRIGCLRQMAVEVVRVS
jgi:hypothetical protein